MAAIFCLFSVTLCKLATKEVPESMGLSNDNRNSDIPISLSTPQLIKVPSMYTSPCPNHFRYTFNGKEWFGLLAVPSLPLGRTFHMKVFLSLGINYNKRYVGDISLAKDRQSTVNDVANGLPILYKVRFPVQNPLPKVTAIYYNSQLLCTGPKDVGGIVTTISLDHTLYTGLAQQNFQNNENAFTKPPIVTVPPPTRVPTPPPTRIPSPPVTLAPTAPPIQSTSDGFVFPVDSTTSNQQQTISDERINEYTAQCGVTYNRLQQATGLVVKGKEAYKGQFPWLAAYYHNDIGDSGFICGGSLISSKVVLTAAHCIQDKQDETARQPEEALIYLGKYYLHTQANERDFLVSGATNFIVHPDWNAFTESYDADIAAIILLRKIQFTNFIRPICIWASTTGYSDMIRQQGIVAGYGKTEFSVTATDKPFWADLPVVDDGTCLRSNSVFSKITSSRTFCAGNRDGRGPCNGDSGGGFVKKYGERWYLRGIISSALYDKDLLMCDTSNYAVFTDVTVFRDWILKHIEVYG